jgi:hypothetical protein
MLNLKWLLFGTVLWFRFRFSHIQSQRLPVPVEDWVTSLHCSENESPLCFGRFVRLSLLYNLYFFWFYRNTRSKFCENRVDALKFMLNSTQFNQFLRFFHSFLDFVKFATNFYDFFFHLFSQLHNHIWFVDRFEKLIRWKQISILFLSNSKSFRFSQAHIKIVSSSMWFKEVQPLCCSNLPIPSSFSCFLDFWMCLINLCNFVFVLILQLNAYLWLYFQSNSFPCDARSTFWSWPSPISSGLAETREFSVCN